MPAAFAADSLGNVGDVRLKGYAGERLDAMIERKSLEALDVGVFERDILRLETDSGVTRGAINLSNLRAAAQRIYYSVFAAAAADD